MSQRRCAPARAHGANRRAGSAARAMYSAMLEAANDHAGPAQFWLKRSDTRASSRVTRPSSPRLCGAILRRSKPPLRWPLRARSNTPSHEVGAIRWTRTRRLRAEKKSSRSHHIRGLKRWDFSTSARSAFSIVRAFAMFAHRSCAVRADLIGFHFGHRVPHLPARFLLRRAGRRREHVQHMQRRG